MGFRLRSSGCFWIILEQDIYHETVYEGITVEFIGRDSGIKFFGRMVYVDFAEGADQPFFILHFKKNGNDLTGVVVQLQQAISFRFFLVVFAS